MYLDVTETRQLWRVVQLCLYLFIHTRDNYSHIIIFLGAVFLFVFVLNNSQSQQTPFSVDMVLEDRNTGRFGR